MYGKYLIRNLVFYSKNHHKMKLSTEYELILMGYLVCKRCNGYYELLKGESPDDYERCQCGGKLKYVIYLNSDIDCKYHNCYDNTKVCPKCGKDNIKTVQICVFCGHNFETKEKSISPLVGFAAILMGILLVLIPIISLIGF